MGIWDKLKFTNFFDNDKFFLAKNYLMTSGDPFYSYMAGQCNCEVTKEVQTISIKEEAGSIWIGYNKDWIEATPVEKIAEAIKHCLNHLIMGHLSNGAFNDDKNPNLDVAMDLAVNSYLDKKLLPEGFMHPDDFKLPKEKATLEYLEELNKMFPPPPPQPGEGENEEDKKGKNQQQGQSNSGSNNASSDDSEEGNEEDSGGGNEEDKSGEGKEKDDEQKDGKGKDGKDKDKKDGEGNDKEEDDKGGKNKPKPQKQQPQNQGVKKTGDDHSYMKSQSSESQMENHVSQMVSQAHDKSGGRLPSSYGSQLLDLIKIMLQPSEIPWQVILRQFVAFCSQTKNETTWKKPNRRFGEVCKGRKKKQILNILVHIDESGSVGNEEWELFINEIDAIHKTKAAKITVSKFTTKVEKTFEYKGLNDMLLTRYSGGTFFQPSFDLSEKEKPDCVIFFTDGFNCDVPCHYSRPKTVLWALVPGGQVSEKFGKTIQIKNNKKSMQRMVI